MKVTVHHLAAISGNLQKTIAFYHTILGFKYSIKKSKDAGPKVCSFYCDEMLEQFITFYQCRGLRKGRAGINSVRSIGFLVDAGAMSFWENRLKQFKIPYKLIVDEIEDSRAFSFCDPDGLRLRLVLGPCECNRSYSLHRFTRHIRGIHNIEIVSENHENLKNLFAEQFKMGTIERSASSNRFISHERSGSVIDVHTGFRKAGVPSGCGLIHHLALEIHNGNEFLRLCTYLKRHQQRTIFCKKRNGYYSLYFWVSGMLFEIVGRKLQKSSEMQFHHFMES